MFNRVDRQCDVICLMRSKDEIPLGEDQNLKATKIKPLTIKVNKRSCTGLICLIQRSL